MLFQWVKSFDSKLNKSVFKVNPLFEGFLADFFSQLTKTQDFT